MEAVSLFRRILVPLGQLVGEAVDILEDLVHLGWLKTVGESCAVHD